MIHRGVAQKYVQEMAWPAGQTIPRVLLGCNDAGQWMVRLHEPILAGWADRAIVVGTTPEGALQGALERWLEVKGLNNHPLLYVQIRRLTN